MLRIKKLYLSFLLLFSVNTLYAQIDSIDYKVGLLSAFSGKDYVPHYITANRFGILQDTDTKTGLLRAAVITGYKASEYWRFDVGIDVIATTSSAAYQKSPVFLQQGYVKVKFKAVELVAGRIERTAGTHAQDLSSGSLAISGNARPLPQVSISIPEYTPIPLTHGYAEVKGNFAHGWFGEDRNVKNAYLHDKSLYLRFGGKLPINFAAGLVHYVVWGGETNKYGKLPQDFKNYLNLVVGKNAENVDLNNPNLVGEVANAVGNHIGVIDFALYTKLKDFDIKVYHQTPVEDGTGRDLFRNKDRLLGISFENKKSSLIKSIAYEYLYTLYQSGPGRTGDGGEPSNELYGYRYGGRDNYYNNYLYKTGWVYQDRIIGTPLFFTKARMQLYVPGFKETDPDNFNFNIVNNRVVAHHIGIEGTVKNIDYKLMSTFTKNYGTYAGINGGINYWGSIENPDAPYAFRPPKKQNYFLLELESHPFSNTWTLTTAIAWDAGELSNNFGVLAGIRKNGIINIRK